MRREHAARERLERDGVAGIAHDSQGGDHVLEDDVIKYVIAALGIVRDPGDPVALEAFARCVLSPHFLQEVLASPPFPLSASTASPPDPCPLLAAIRPP